MLLQFSVKEKCLYMPSFSQKKMHPLSDVHDAEETEVHPHVSEPHSEEQRCPPTWDGWQCWPEGGVPGRKEFQPCPSHIYFHSQGTRNNGEFIDSCGSEYFLLTLSCHSLGK